MRAYHTAVYPAQHQVSYLRLQDVIGVCVYHTLNCLSGTTCVLVVVQYLVYCCLSGTTCIPVIVPIYHYFIVPAIYLVYCIIPVCPGDVIIELVSAKDA